MKTYKVMAKSVGYLEATVEAKDADDAYAQLEDLLMDGAVPEIDGWIQDKQVEEIVE